MRITLSASTIIVVWGLLYFRVGPVPTWFYVFAWYPTLILLDAIASRSEGRPSLFADRWLTVSLFAWSPVIWLVFEAANLRLHNWYYATNPKPLEHSSQARLTARRARGIMEIRPTPRGYGFHLVMENVYAT